MSLLKHIKPDSEPPDSEKSNRTIDDSNTPPEVDLFTTLKNHIRHQLEEEIGLLDDLTISEEQALNNQIDRLFDAALKAQNLVLSRSERRRLRNRIAADLTGFGLLEDLINDNRITVIMVNAYARVYVVDQGKLRRISGQFESERQLQRIIDRLAHSAGIQVDKQSAFTRFNLPGLRIEVITPPVAFEGTVLFLSKYPSFSLTPRHLLDFGSLSQRMLEFLRACVVADCNLIITGKLSTGKTTLLNILAGFIPEHERIIVIEAEPFPMLQLSQEHVVRFRESLSLSDAQAGASLEEIVQVARRLHPDRLVISNLKGSSVFDVLTVLSHGHKALTAMQASSPEDGLKQLETLVQLTMKGMDAVFIRENYLAPIIDFVVHVERLRDGSRKVTRITEVQSIEGDEIKTADIFIFEETSSVHGRITGHFAATGIQPDCIYKLTDAGINLPAEFFAAGIIE